jgi:hypothetical protein
MIGVIIMAAGLVIGAITIEERKNFHILAIVTGLGTLVIAYFAFFGVYPYLAGNVDTDTFKQASEAAGISYRACMGV